MDDSFVKADSNNLPKIDSQMVASFFHRNPDFLSSEVKHVKTMNMEEDFLSKNNPCGLTLLQLVSRGNAVIAELLRLKDHVPKIFRLETKADLQKYGDILLDFNYFSASEAVEKKIESNDSLRALSDEVWESHGQALERFYLAYESVYRYISDLNLYIDEVEEGTYLQQTLETIFLSPDGLQLMCESVYLYGVMLLILELYHGCPVRERIVVAYSRYNITVESLDQVCQLIRATGFNNATGKKPLNYPQDLFRRVEIKEKVLNMIVGKLRTEDIYHGQKVLPLSHQCTTALAQQASLLFVSLFFCPQLLHSGTARMREIVDKFFPDNWIVNVYMGITVNLIEVWEPFRAARLALANTLEATNIHEFASHHANTLKKLLAESDEVLSEGVLTKSYLLEHTSQTLALVSECNVTLRWLLLHTAQQHSLIETVKKCRGSREQVLTEVHFDPASLLKLLFNSAELETKIRDLFQAVLRERASRWETDKQECLTRVRELTEIFSGTKSVMRIKKSDSFRKWFEDISVEIDSLDLEEPNLSSRKIAQLVQALDEVQGDVSFREMNKNLGVKQLVSEASDLLRGMLGACSLRDTVLVQLQVMSDFSYGWLQIHSFSSIIQDMIREEPRTAARLRSLFLKLSSALETPLLRINQAGDGDLPSVSQYYSQQLLATASRILHVIPRSVFKLMGEIAELQTREVPELPARLQKDRLRDYACLPHRFMVAKLTDKVSAFSRGLLSMESTRVGVVQLEPGELLQAGIRRELAQHILSALDSALHFSLKKGSDLKQKLVELATTMEGHKNSFEYVQDYIGINGVKMWQEELKQALLESAEVECKLLHKKTYPFEVEGVSCMGRLTKALLSTADPRSTLFVEHESAWVEWKSRQKVLDLNIFKTLLSALSVPGLVAVDRILATLIVRHLQELLKFLQKEANNNKAWLEMFGGIAKSLSPNTVSVEEPVKVYGRAVSRLGKLFSTGHLYESLTAVGNLQALRHQLAFLLRQSARTQARNYTSALANLNDAVLSEVVGGDEKKEVSTAETGGVPAEELGPLSELLAWVGHTQPYQTVYLTCRPLPYLALALWLFTASHLARFTYDKALASHVCQRSGEGWALLALGLHTLLSQFHTKVFRGYTLLGCQYARSYMLFAALAGQEEVPVEGLNSMAFLEELLRRGGHSRSLLTAHIPELILDLFKHGLNSYVNG